MRKLATSIVVMGLLMALNVQLGMASHFVGGNYQTECVGGCTLRVHLRLYRDCTGVASFSTATTFNPLNSCAAPPALTSWSTQAIVEVTPVCPGTVTQCTSAGATLNGVQEYYWWRDYNVCSLSGCEYELNWSDCCRNGIITSGAANESMILTHRISVGTGCNNSPVFTNNPIFYACTGMSYAIHQGAYDPDGDSLAYAMSACYQLSGTPVTYAVGYSPTQPLGPSWNCTMDPATGILSLQASPGNAAVGVVCFKVSEYRNGVLIGEVLRDMQVIVGNFCGATASPTLSTITNLTGGAALTAPSTVQVCGGTPFCFDITATDPDTSTGQTLKLYWDNHIPGATFTETGNPSVVDTVAGNSPNATFCWTAPATPGTYQFLLTVEDDGCPLPSFQDQLITIQVLPGSTTANIISATGTLHACAGTGDTLLAAGGYTSYLWNTAATTQGIVANAPGTYSVTATTAAGCTVTDTHTVVAVATIDISGVITDHLGGALANQRVWLIRHDTAALFLEDSTMTDAAGNYSFCNVGLDTAYVKAAPSQAAYPNEFPTYADTAIVWANARPIPSASFPATVSFSTQFGTNPGGTGFIGGLISMGANKTDGPGDPVPNQEIILYSTTLGHPVAHTVTDANGYFGFYFLPLGDYKVIADKPGVDHIVVPTLTLDNQHTFYDSLDFRLHTTYLELVWAVGTSNPATQLGFTIAPNPIEGKGRIELTLPQAGEVKVALSDGLGRELLNLGSGWMTAGTHKWSLEPAALGLAKGIYFVRLDAGDAHRVVKVMVQ